MDRRLLRVPIMTVVLAAGFALGNAAQGAHSPPAPVALALNARNVSMVLTYPSGRAHPEGPDADEQTIRSRPSYPSSAAPLWTGGGRHPVWRGCQHTYDPKLGRFIFSSGPASQ
jgi:hypothetical protein